MKKYLVFSDIHGNKKSYEKLKLLAKDYDGVIFAGDGDINTDDFAENGREVYRVKGNCDYLSREREEIVFESENLKILVTHGHLNGVKGRLDRLFYHAKESGANVVIYGHTHRAIVTDSEGILFLNPGTCSAYAAEKTCAVLTIDNGKAQAEILSGAL